MSKFVRQKYPADRISENVRAKWGDDVPDEGFVPMPKRFLRILDGVLGPSDELDELRALLAVVDFQRKELKQYPSVDYLAFLAGLKVSEFKAAADRLIHKELLRELPTEEDDSLSYEGVHYSYDNLLKKICELTSAPDD
jgi:hypothetical protein